ncbi:signal peptide peptidase SppA [Leptospira perolatii]|nr:signal peptide peptidase SppA [Leptospira perolatii]
MTARPPIPYQRVLKSGSSDKILIIPIDGPITDESREGNFFMEGKDSILAGLKLQLELATEDPDIKAVLLKINSPGGTVTSSDILYRELMEFKKKKKVPVSALFMDMAASGAYYIAMSSDYIVVHPTSVTGSIGVIMQGINLKEGLEKLGIKDQSIRSGDNKAIGSPLQDLTPEQRKLLQGIVDSLYERFFEVVKNGRPKLKEADLRKLADGRIYTATQAVKNGLVDSMGYFEDAVKATVKLPGYSGSAEPQLIYYSYSRRPGTIYHVQANAGEAPTLMDTMGLGKHKFQFLYLFAP